MSNLPPGCTQREIDAQLEDPDDRCWECGGDRNHCECVWYECDCCGETVKEIYTVIAFGIETHACEKCTSGGNQS